MATIVKRKNKDGSFSYRVQVRVKQDGQVVHSESRTFDSERIAKDWGAKIDTELAKEGGVTKRRLGKTTIGDLIQKYIDEVEPVQNYGRTKAMTLRALLGKPIASISVNDLSAAHLVDHCKFRHGEGAGPATTMQDVIYLGSVLGVAQPLWGLPVSRRAVEGALPILQKLKLVGHSLQRDRRLAPGEYDRLIAHWAPTHAMPGRTPPMHEIIPFAIASCMRCEEITRLRWVDIDESKRTVIVRQRKDPSKKAINDQVVPLLGEAWDILQRQPKMDAFVFPYNHRSIGAAFNRICKAAGIEDLHFHDLRHEGISRLFEQGYQIQQVAMVSGHKGWNSLKRYTNLKPESLHRTPPAQKANPPSGGFEGRSDRR